MSPVWKVGDDVAWVDGGARVALLDLSQPAELPVVLTETSALIWSEIDGERDEDEIVTHVAAVFEVDGDEIREQVRAFLEDLASRRLIVRA